MRDEEGMERREELEGGSPGAKLQALGHLPGEHMPITFFCLTYLKIQVHLTFYAW